MNQTSGTARGSLPDARRTANLPGPVNDRYEALISTGAIERDAAQVAAVRQLDAILQVLGRRKRATKGSALGWLFKRKDEPDLVKGLYVWGSVGRGKTMLMDLFYDEALRHPRGGSTSTASLPTPTSASTPIGRR